MPERPTPCDVQPIALLDPGWVRRSLAALLAGGGLLGALWLAVVDASAPATASVVVTVAAVLLLAAWVAIDNETEVKTLLATVLLVCGALITVEIALSGPATSPFPLFYIWLLPWSFILWDLRRASAYVGAIAVAYGALLVTEAEDLARVVPAWLVGMGGVVAVGWVLRAVCDRLLERHGAARRSGDAQGLITEFSRLALAQLDVDRSLGDDAARLVRDALAADCVQVFRASDGALVRTGSAGAEVAARHPDEAFDAQIGEPGAPVGLVHVVRTSRALDDHETSFVRSVADVLALATTRAVAERERRDRAGHDTLTGLPGRERFAAHLAAALPRGGNLFLLDLDDFGLVNETLGPRAGDMLLRSVAQRLRSVLGARVQLARVGGDELALFEPGVATETAALDVAGRVQRVFAAPFDLAETEHHVSASIGIVLCPPGTYRDERAAIRDAHVAQRRAKELGRGRHELFNADVRASLERRRSLEQELRLGLKRGEFRLVFQPIVQLENRRVIGAEALVRWQHPTRGLLAPGEFIDVAEASDLIVPLGAWILRDAFRQLKAWESTGAGFEGFRLSINLSGRQLAAPGFPSTVRRLLEMHALDPGRIVFELTETALADESDQVERAVAELRDLGISLSLDDFGTGYASLSYVRRFAFDSLKLDRSFVANVGGDASDTALITAAISMGAAMNMKVVAEGVETVEQVAQLRELGCVLGQGYLFARPMEAGGIRELVDRDAGLRR
ncbi:MAG TPA: bifunctional diguanylate cyclase/phosphodiesterase [Solirubrobacteraceae bacterium]|nr:bifunctional diguanylate cyclase/phosphodiesterase [Solirubrobacteraceae bacterium]